MALDSAIKIISQQFLSACPIKKISWHDIFPSLNWDLQMKLVEITVNFAKNLTYPVKISYQKSFLKFIIDNLIELKIEICDEIYNRYGELVAKAEDNFYYRHFLLGDNVVTIRENVNIISEGTTGLSTWQAGVVLAEWCILNKQLLRKQKIVELGSGVGLTGITILQMCEPLEMYVTDAHDKVLENLCFNINLNTTDVGSGAQSKFPQSILCRSFRNTKIDVLDLPWKLVSASLGVNATIVLAADVVYDSSLFSDLINAVDSLLCDDKSLFVLASTERNKNTLWTFISLLGDRFIVDENPAPDSNYFYYPFDEKVYIHLIRKKRLD